MPVTPGFAYAQVPDPYAGTKPLIAAYRSDGRALPAENAWHSKSRILNGPWSYHINLFDADTAPFYTLVFGSATSGNQPPQIQFIANQTVAVGERVSFFVEASDPDGQIPTLSASPLPPGAEFLLDESSAALVRYIFDWTPQSGQNGPHEITFTAEDGTLTYHRTATIRVTSPQDTDGDGMEDAWEMLHFGSLNRDGSGDFDGDGVTDLDEFHEGTDPTETGLPDTPVIDQPSDGSRDVSRQPLLQVLSIAHDPQTAVTYDFELYGDESLSEQLGTATVAEQTGTTTWQVEVLLNDNQWHFWPVRTCTATLCSDWAYASFFVNTVDDPPGSFHISSPQFGTDVSDLQPVLSVTNSLDPDEEPVTYRFEVAESQSFAVPSAQAETSEPVWAVDPALSDNQWYHWRAQALDPQGLESAWTYGYIFVNENGLNDPPQLTLTQPASNVVVSDGTVRIAWEDDDPDSNALLDLYYEVGARGTGGIPIVAGLAEDPDGDLEDAYLWDVSALPVGEYHVFGRISDGTSEASSYAPGSVTIVSQQVGTVSVTLEDEPVTREGGGSTRITVVLDTRPTDAVKIPIASSDPGEGQVDLPNGKLTFTPGKWNRPQSFSVHGIDDCLLDGDVVYNIAIGPAESNDPSYDGMDPGDVYLTNRDDEQAGAHPMLAICDITRIHKKRVDANTTEYEYKAEIANSGSVVNGAFATAASLVPEVQVIDASLEFGSVPGGGTSLSLDTISIRHHPDFPFDTSMLSWSISTGTP